MSKIGKNPITILEGVTITVTPDLLTVKSASHTKEFSIPKGIKPILGEKELTIEVTESNKQARSNWGTFRAIVANTVQGMKKEFEKTLLLEGVGFRITKEGNDLSFSLGFSHPVRYKAPENIVFEVEKNTILKIKGFDKAQVGQVAAEIRALKKPDPYKGKGFRYNNEIIRRKAGKKASSTGSA